MKVTINLKLVASISSDNNPAYTKTLELESTVLDFKHQISQDFPENPHFTSIKLIYSGKLLSDDQKWKDLISENLLNLDIPQVVHMVISNKNRAGKNASQQISSNTDRNSPVRVVDPSIDPFGLHSRRYSNSYTPERSQTAADQNGSDSDPSTNNNGFEQEPGYVDNNRYSPYIGAPNWRGDGWRRDHPIPDNFANQNPQEQVPQNQWAPPPNYANEPVGNGRRIFENENFTLLAKLVIFAFILTHNRNFKHSMILYFVLVVVYLYCTGRLSIIPRIRFVQRLYMNNNYNNNESNQNGAQNSMNQGENNGFKFPKVGALGELCDFFVPLLWSLWPWFNVTQYLTLRG